MRKPPNSLLLCLGCFSALFTAISGNAQSQAGALPISKVLAPDGSILSSASGSFDPRGYAMVAGSSGEPRFVPAAPAGGCVPDNWDTSFTTNGANNDVNAIVSDGAGNLYFGGNFSSIQGTPINGIAKWDGSAWSALGTGVNGEVNAIALVGSDVYVGGSFASAGGVLARNVAKWNGSSWSPLGAGLGGGTHVVESIAVLGTDIYIGGNFNTADGSPANGLVRWDGSYSAAGVSGQVYSLSVSGGNLYVGGSVNVIADPTMAGLVKWDGVSWSGFGLSTSTTVRSIGINGSDIYVGGLIRRPGSSETHVARWNGTAWTSLGFFANSPTVLTFAFVGTDVYAGGTFERFNGLYSDGIMKYNGSQWLEVGTGTQLGSADVYSLLVSGNTLYIGGDFMLAGGVAAKNIATLTNGTTWAAPFPGTGIDSPASAIAVSGTDVYVGGSFLSAGPVTANRIAKWNSVTNTWSALGTGVSGFNTENSSISAIAVAGGKVYAGGSFPRIGGVTAANIAVWNGTNWAALGTGITGGNARVSVIVVQGEDVIVGGDFTTAGGVAANRIAKWNGTSWSAFPGSPPIPSGVTGIGFVGSDMYVGSTSTAVENPNYLLKFDGATWSGLAPGMGGHGVTSVAVAGSDVYISGGFQAVAGVPAFRIAKWNGSFWSPVGGGLPTTTGSASVFLGASGNDIIAVGDFTVAAGGPANYIAKWNGSNWSAMGNGLNAPASRVVAAGGDILFGGGFTRAGCNISPYFARWRETVWTGSTNSDWHTAGNWGGGSVPPTNGSVTIASNNASITTADVTLSELILTGGRTLTIGGGRTLTVTRRLDVSNGTLAGPGAVVVNDLNLNDGSVTGVSSVTINGNLYLGTGVITGGPVSVISCRAGAIAGGSGTSFVWGPLTRCVNSSGTYRFPVGTESVFAPVELMNVVGTSSFTVDPRSGPYPGGINGLPDNRLGRWWELINGGITQADITFSYSDSEVVGRESWYRAYRINAGSAVQLPTVINTTSNRMTVTGVSTFSSWTLAEGTPAPATLSGRATRPSGRGAWGVLVSLTDDQGNTNYTMTNPFGYYRFVNVPTFRQYTVRVTSKRYTFAAPERTVPFDEYTTAVNFVSSDH